MSGVADIAPYTAGGTAPCAGADPLRPGPGRFDRVQHRRPARRAIPGRPGAGAPPAARGADRPGRQLCLRHRAAPSSASTSPSSARSARIARGCRFARPARRSSPSRARRLGADQCADRRDRAQRAPRQLAVPAQRFERAASSGERFTLNRLACAARQVARRRSVFDAARFERHFRRRGNRRHLQRRQGDDRQCPAAARRGCRASGAPSAATSASTRGARVSDRAANPRFYPLRQQRPSAHHRRRCASAPPARSTIPAPAIASSMCHRPQARRAARAMPTSTSPASPSAPASSPTN